MMETRAEKVERLIGECEQRLSVPHTDNAQERRERQRVRERLARLRKSRRRIR